MRTALTLLLRLFPRAFRDEFGDAMREQIALDHERARTRGAAAVMWFALATAFDLARSAIAEHMNPSWVARPVPASQEKGMQWTPDSWARDFRHAARSLARSRAFTLVAAGTLGLAIGVNGGMFSVVNRVLLEPLPFEHPERLVYIGASAPGSDFPEEFGVSAEFYLQYKEQSRLLEDVATFNSFTNTLRTDDRVERVRMSWPTNSLFSTLGARPILGRLPVPEDENRVAVISYALWNSWFGGDSSVLGRTYEMAGDRRTIVGVMGPEFRFPNDETLLWISSEIRAEGLVPGRFGSGLIARMAPGATPEAVARELNVLAQRLPARFGGSANYARLIGQHRAVVRTLREELLGDVSRPLWVLLGAVGIVLLIACVNVANLFMVRAEGRQRELAVRRAIGAARGELIRLQISESLVMAALAGAIAILLAWITLPTLLRAAPAGIPRLADVRLDVATVLFTLGAAFLSALACGVVPAFRSSAPDLGRLREGGRGATRGRRWARDGLVAAQTALALVLLIGSGLLLRSFNALRQVDPGYDTENIFTFQIAPEEAHLTDGPSYARFSLAFLERLRGLPGVQSVGLIENVPLNEGTALAPFRTEEMVTAADAGVRLGYTFTAGDYFKTMGIALLAGRPFTDRDHEVPALNVILSKSAAERLWPGRDPIGRRLQRQGPEWHTVVGVVDDVLWDNFREPPEATVYLPLVGNTAQSWVISSPAYVIRTPRAETIAPEVRAIVHEIAPSAPMYRIFTMAGLAADSMVQLSFTMLTLGIVSMLALFLGAVGLYGVLSYVVAERTREIGVRMALGARTDQVRRMVVLQGARIVAIGVVIGVLVALASARLLGNLLFGVPALDLLTFAAMSGSMVLIGLLASYLPARRASNVDPIESLRSE